MAKLTRRQVLAGGNIQFNGWGKQQTYDNALEIVTIAGPKDIRLRKKDSVASYGSPLACNSAVICGEFGDVQADGEARDKLPKLHPAREIILLNTDPNCESGRGLHCSMQQQPRAGI